MTRLRIGPIKDFALGIYDGPHATPKESDAGPVFLGIKNVTPQGTLDLSEIRHVSEEEYPKWTKRVVPQADDIVFSYEATLHRYAIIPEGFRGCLGRRMALVRPDQTTVHPRFLHYYFLTPDWRAVVESNVINGATVDRVPLTRFPDFPVQLPHLDIQKRIAFILSAYDDLIENNRRRIRLLEQAARLLYKEWFVHLRFPGHEHVTITDCVPEGWEKAPLGKVTSIVMGNSPKGNTYNDIGEGMPLVNGPVEFGEVFTKRVKWTTRPSRVCRANDLVVCVRGSTTGRNVKSDGEYCLGRGVCAISGSEQAFVDASFRENLPALLSLTTGATFPSWSGPALKSFPVLWPSETLRKLFEFHCAPIVAQIRSLYEQSRRHSAARDLLLPRLMNGEIAV